MSVYSMSGPTYSGLSKFDLLDSALSQPLSLTSTLFEEGKGGALESFGLGTVLRRGSLPEEAPVQDGVDQNGNAIVGTGDVYVPPNVGMRDALMGTWGDTPAQLEQRRQDAGALTEDQYKASPSFRKDIPYDPGMTETRAAALAAMDDAKKVREFYAQKRPIAAFLGSMAGQALDPINYVPVGGPLVKAAAIGRFGRIGGEALAASLDAAANTALFGIGTADARAQLGDDVSWQALISQIATAGLIGSAFGTIHGAIGARIDARRMTEAEQRLSTLQTTMESRIALNEGIDAIVRGEDVNLSPNATEPLQRVAATIDETPAARLNAPPVDEKAYISDRAYRGAFHAQYGEGVSSRTTPSTTPIPEVGTWRISETKGLYGRDIERLDQVPIADLILPEVRDGQLDVAKRGDDATYAKWLQEGKEPPPIEMIRTEDGRLRVTDGHRRVLAAKMAGADTIKGWVSELAPTGKVDVSGRPMTTSLTFELAQQQRALTPTAASRTVAIDTTNARAELAPEGVVRAQASIAKPEDTKALAAQYGVDANTGAFKEEAEIAQLADEGRLTEQDVATMTQAHADYEVADAYAEAIKSVASCLV